MNLEKPLSEPDPVETPSFEAQPPVEIATVAETPAPDEPTVGTGSYIGASCAVAMLVLTVILIGVVYLLRWIG